MIALSMIYLFSQWNYQPKKVQRSSLPHAPLWFVSSTPAPPCPRPPVFIVADSPSNFVSESSILLKTS